MKAILISIKPKWCAKIMNKEKTIEVRKGAALYKATKKLIDEYGFADFYVYCTKALPLIRYIDENIMFLSCSTNTIKNERESGKYLNGKVVFKFRCYKVERTHEYAGNLLKDSCLTIDEFCDYLGDKIYVYAIHISDLEIFDKPKELSEFKVKKTYICKNCPPKYQYGACSKDCTEILSLTKAPQSWCYVEADQ